MAWKTEPCLTREEIPPCSLSIPAGSRNLPLILQPLEAPLSSCLSSRTILGEFSMFSAQSHPSLWVQGSGHWARLSKASLLLGNSHPLIPQRSFPIPSSPDRLGGREIPYRKPQHGGIPALSPHSTEFPGILHFLEPPTCKSIRKIPMPAVSWFQWDSGCAGVPAVTLWELSPSLHPTGT